VQNYFLETRKQYGYLPKFPILVIGTKYDRIFPYSYARGLFRAILMHNPRTYFRRIKPSGHMPAIEAPKRLAYQMRMFIQKNEAQPLQSIPKNGNRNSPDVH
jgi:pimeloyl-ACP methyl ester carboxylesterase